MAETESDAITLSTPVGRLAGVGPTRGRYFAALGVATAGGLLDYFPRAYQAESEERPVAELRPGAELQSARGEVAAVNYIASRPRSRFEATVNDGTGPLACVWFNGGFMRRTVHPGAQLRVRGKVTLFRGLPQMTNPKWQLVTDATPVHDQASFRPLYPASGKLPGPRIERVVQDNLPALLPLAAEWFMPDLLRARRLLSRADAYRLIHQPRDWRDAEAARRRLMYDELMLLQLGLGLSKRLRDGRLSSPVIRLDKTLDARIRSRFPFDLTGQQQQAVWQIARDLGASRPMNRLLQGDVGSGKTVVALYAMLMAVANKLQAALLAPTEVLAEQHYMTISRLLEGSGVRVGRFTGRSKRGKDARALLDDLARGRVHLAIGTQALIQKDVDFANLGLIVIDEQHKLGVQQRGILRDKAHAPHYLVMTATPIPRTLALSYFADFDLTTISELPPGRQRIETRWLRGYDSHKAYEFIRSQIDQGRQAYIVLPQIDDAAGTGPAGINDDKSGGDGGGGGEKLGAPGGPGGGAGGSSAGEGRAGGGGAAGGGGTAGDGAARGVGGGSTRGVAAGGGGSNGPGEGLPGIGGKSVTAEFDRLSRGPLAGLRLAMLHGRMNADERGETMTRFRDGTIDVLIATTVIEVGIDVPNATIILIDDADRFGLSQLHQLRGRVGRGSHPSFCVLMSDSDTPDAAARLNAMTQTSDGFEIAELDLQLRGPGEFFGTRQHGLPQTKLVDITKELELLRVARDDAQALLESDFDLRRPEHAALRAALLERFGDSIPLAQIG